ncbi:MAG TPA: SRPBCC family protein, partial [Dehalococcoidia bacterium]|nr:SRPBCC family protein [Dehalococcoidia bacterium]
GSSLERHLGNARLALDYIFGQGLIVGKGHHKFGYNGNWKLQLENTVDGYHVGILHKAYFEILERRTGKTRAPDMQAGRTRDLGNGHNTLAEDPYDPDYQVGPMGLNFNVGIFPNLDILALERGLPTQIRVIRPVAVNRTEVTLFPLLKKDAPPEVNFDRLRRYEEFYGPGGFASPDDWEIFNRIQKGIQADSQEGSQWVLHLRGLDNEEIDERGIRTNRGGFGEASQRAIYRHWKQAMAEE